MKDVVPKPQGMLKTNTSVDTLIFSAIKQDVLSYLLLTSKVLQEITLIMPKLITTCASVVANIKKL